VQFLGELPKTATARCSARCCARRARRRRSTAKVAPADRCSAHRQYRGVRDGQTTAERRRTAINVAEVAGYSRRMQDANRCDASRADRAARALRVARSLRWPWLTQPMDDLNARQHPSDRGPRSSGPNSMARESPRRYPPEKWSGGGWHRRTAGGTSVRPRNVEAIVVDGPAALERHWRSSRWARCCEARRPQTPGDKQREIQCPFRQEAFFLTVARTYEKTRSAGAAVPIALMVGDPSPRRIPSLIVIQYDGVLQQAGVAYHPLSKLQD